MADAKVTRRLAAILAADVVGYSKMMGADEAGTLAALRDIWQAEFDPCIGRHNGRIAKKMGDGALAEFASVVDAVSCAVAFQRAMAARNSAQNSAMAMTARRPLNSVSASTWAISGSRTAIFSATA